MRSFGPILFSEVLQVMRNLLHLVSAAVMVTCVVGFGATPALADGKHDQGNTVNVSQGTSKGTAGFDDTGIAALANQPRDAGRPVVQPNGPSPGGTPTVWLGPHFHRRPWMPPQQRATW